MMEVVEWRSRPKGQPRSSSAVDSLNDALAAGFETRCVECCTVVGAPGMRLAFHPLFLVQATQKECISWQRSGRQSSGGWKK
jgi:hypothetical protein